MKSHSRGFTLIEIVVVLLVLSVLLSMAVRMTSGMQAAATRGTTERRLNGAAEALANYVMQQRRLPCPADGALPSTDPQAGRERRTGATCTDAQARGVVPWVTLGITEQEATDGWGSRLTYRVASQMVADEAMNFTACDQAGTAGLGATTNGCAPCVSGGVGVPGSCTSPGVALAGKGIEVRAGGVPIGSAAYMVVSAGENRLGSYVSATGVAFDGAAMGSEAQNVAPEALKAYYNDEPLSTTFDDMVARLPVLALAQRAGLGPRVHQPAGS